MTHHLDTQSHHGEHAASAEQCCTNCADCGLEHVAQGDGSLDAPASQSEPIVRGCRLLPRHVVTSIFKPPRAA